MATNPQGEIGPGRSDASTNLSGGTSPNGPVPESFDPAYVAGAVAPFLQASTYVGERPSLPMIDLTLSKEKAVGLGLNWYLTKQVKVSVNYEHTTFEGGATDGDRPSEDFVVTRFQHSF